MHPYGWLDLPDIFRLTEPELRSQRVKTPDSIDRQILALLKQDGRMPLKTISGRVGLARSSVQERIARLEAGGVIRRYTIEEDRQAAGLVAAYLWVRTESAICERIAPKLLALPEVVVCRSIAGELDMVAHVEAESPQRIAEIRAMVAVYDGVTSVETHLVLQRLAETPNGMRTGRARDCKAAQSRFGLLEPLEQGRRQIALGEGGYDHDDRLSRHFRA